MIFREVRTILIHRILFRRILCCFCFHSITSSFFRYRKYSMLITNQYNTLIYAIWRRKIRAKTESVNDILKYFYFILKWNIKTTRKTNPQERQAKQVAPRICFYFVFCSFQFSFSMEKKWTSERPIREYNLNLKASLLITSIEVILFIQFVSRELSVLFLVKLFLW